MTWIYIHFYTDRKTADIFKYFDDSKIMFDTVFDNPYVFFQMLFGINSDSLAFQQYYHQMVSWYDSDMMYNDNRLIIRFNCVMRFISFGNYYIHVVFMSFITFFGLTCLFKLFASEIKEKYLAVFIAVFFLPSVMFWGSGVLKDGVILFASSVFLYNFNLLLNNSARIINKLLFAIALILMITVKLYVLAIMFPGIILLTFIKRKPKWQLNKLRYWLATYLFFALCIYSLKYFSTINVVELISLKQHQFMALAITVGSGSLLTMPELSNLESIFYGLPHSLYNSFFKPFIFDSSSPVIIMAGIENLLLLLFTVYSLSIMKKENIYYSPYFFFSLFFTLILFMLIGLIVPVAGALVRYKTIALPFLAVALIILTDKNKAGALLIKLKLMP